VKLSECKRCSLCKKRLHLSHRTGSVPSSTLVIFGKEPLLKKDYLNIFIKRLSSILKDDLCYTFAVRCSCKEKPTEEEIKACGFWIRSDIKKVKPYLIVLMGKIAVASLLGKDKTFLPTNIFYATEINDEKCILFVAPAITADPGLLDKSLKKLLLYIGEHYR